MLKAGVVALGFFDGCHLGHRKIIELSKNLGGGKAAVLTFPNHPGSVIPGRQAPKLLTTSDERIGLIEAMGLKVFLKTFDREFSTWSCERFAEEILVHRLGVARVVVGYDYRFGHRAKGDVAKLGELGQQLGFSTTVVQAMTCGEGKDELVVSSTKIRQAIAEGELELASSLMGRPYFASAVVIKGSEIGRKLGFPTANMEFPEEKVAPPYGVMAIRVTTREGKRYSGVASFGVRPSMDTLDRRPLFEAHLFDFAGDLYGQRLRFEMPYYLRPEYKFERLDALQEQMVKDAKQARSLLG